MPVTTARRSYSRGGSWDGCYCGHLYGARNPLSDVQEESGSVREPERL